MLDNLKRIREPLAWAVLGVVVLAVAIPAVQVLAYANLDDPALLAYSAVAYLAGWSFLLVVLVAAVAVCAIEPAVPRAGVLASLAAWLATVAVGLPLAALAVAAFLRQAPPGVDPSVLGAVPEALLGVVAVAALWALARRGPGSDEIDQDVDAAAAGLPSAPEPESDDRPAVVWSRDDAAGTAWRTADEAAAGAPGSRSIATPDDPEPAPEPRA